MLRLKRVGSWLLAVGADLWVLGLASPYFNKKDRLLDYTLESLINVGPTK